MKNFLKYQFPPLLWILIIYFLSSIPDLHLKLGTPPGTDKLAHAFFYFVLCWLVQRGFYNQDRLLALKNSAYLGAFIFCVVYGWLDEYHQKSVLGRAADEYDLLADVGGALLFVAIAWIRRRPDRDDESGAES